MKNKSGSIAPTIITSAALLLAGSAGDAGTLHFNGATAYVNIGPRLETKITGSSLTLEAWIKPSGRGSDATAGGVIFGREGEYLLARFADGTIRYAVATTSPAWGWSTSGPLAPSNQWTHVALTYNGLDLLVYVNGIQRSQIPGSGAVGDADAARNDFIIGARQAVSQFFQGQIDEVRVWNVARSAPDIQANMSRPVQGNETGLLGYFRFEEGFGLTTADSTGRGLTGTLFGSPAPVWDPASEGLQVPVPITRTAALLTETSVRLGASIGLNGPAISNSFQLATNSSTALSFNGISNSVVFAYGPNTIYNAYPLTVTAWIKTAEPRASGGLVNKYVSGSANGWQIYLLNGQLRAWYFRDANNRVQGDPNGLNGGNVDDGQWHHVAFSVSTNAAVGGKLYVDGLLMATNGWTGTPGASTTTQALRFGFYDVSLAGQIDDVTLWSTELTAATIAQLITAPPTPAHPQYASLVGYWPLDEGTGTAASDAGNRTPPGVLASASQWVPQARPLQYFTTPLTPISGTNSVLDLDGVDDHVRVPPGRWFSNEFTIETWVYQRSYNKDARVIDFGNGLGLNNVILSLSAGTTGRPYFQAYPNGITAADALPLNEWVHLAATLKTNIGTIYLNGVAIVSGAVTAPSGTVLRTNNYIGRSNWGGLDAHANALYDELRLWKVALTPDQLRQFMNEPVAQDNPNLILNYRFDEPSGLTVVDYRSTSPQNGTLTNGASRLPFERTAVNLSNLSPSTRYHFRGVAANADRTVLGQVDSLATPTPAAGTALDLDGRGDYVHTPNLRSHFANETVTLEVWFNARAPGVVVDERSVDLVTWADSQIEIVGTTNALQGEVRIRVWNIPSPAVIPGKVAYGTWNHVALRYNKSALTLDGLLNGVKSGNSITSVDRSAPWESSAAYGLVYALGLADGNNLGSGAWFNGKMDEFRVWNVARTDADILRDFNRRLQGNEPGLVAYYRMDEGAGVIVADATGRGNDGLLLGTNSPARAPSTAPIGWPLVTTSEVRDIVLGDVTMDAMVKGDSSLETRVWVEYGHYVPVPNSARNYFYGYQTNASVISLGQINFNVPPTYAGTFTDINFNGSPPQWPGGPFDYYAARYLGRIFLPATGYYTFYANSDDGSQLYIDGQLVVTNDGLHALLERGASTYLNAGDHWLEARMFNNLGPAALIVSYAGPGMPKQVIPATAFLRHEPLFTSRTPPQTYAVAGDFQDFSAMATNIGASTSHVFRVVVANANGTNYGAEQPVLMGTAGAFTALFFNGLGACVQVPEGTNFLAFSGTDHFTIEAWINPVSLGATQTVVSKFNHPTNREYFLAVTPNGRVVFHRQGSDFASITSVPVGAYTHVAATYDGTSRRIYVNGQLDPALDPGSGPITNSGAPFVIGARYWSNSLANFFQGVIDDVRVWQVPRSQAQIAGDMNRRLSGYELGLVAYYRFDEAQGDVAYDSTVGDYLGSLRNGPVYVPSGVQFACTSTPPVLTIEMLDFTTGLIVWWPVTCNEYILEEADSPQAPPEDWRPVLEPVTPIGETYLVVFLLDRWNDGFFRLRRR